MPTGLLSLPNELKFKICERLLPILRDIYKFPSDVRNLDDDLESIFTTSKSRNIRALAMTCRELRDFCGAFFFLIKKLDCDRDRVKMKVLEDGSLPALLNTTRFLALAGCNSKSRHQSDCWTSADSDDAESDRETSDSQQERPQLRQELTSICKAFVQFSSVTTLHVEDFQLSHTNICALRLLPALTTLSIHVPDFDHKKVGKMQHITRAFTFPKVRNLNLVVFDLKEARSAGNVVKLFEKSIEMLSVKSNDYTDEDQSDFLAAVLAGRRYPARLSALKHLNIDLIGYAPGRLQELVGNTTHLESMMIDCRGIPGFLPLFYVLDLLRLATGEEFDSRPMVHLAYREESPDPDGEGEGEGEGEDTDGDGGEEMEVEAEVEEIEFPYKDKSSIWMAPLGRFSCKFRTVQIGESQKRVVDALELYFAVEDERADSLNKNMRLGHLREVLHSRSTTFKELQTLVVATESTYTYEGDEPPENVEDATEALARYLPSAKRIIVRWWDFEPISWSASSSETASAGDDDMEVDSLWCL